MTIHYFNFAAAFNGNGSAPGQAASPGAAGAWNTVIGVTFVAGDTYRLRRGTTYTDTSTARSALQLLSLTATAASPTTIEAYSNDTTGADDDLTQALPIIDQPVAASGQACIRIWTCNYVIVRNINTTNNVGGVGGGIKIRGQCSNVEVYGCEAEGNLCGIFVSNDTATTATNIHIHDNICTGNALGIGFYFKDDAGSIITNLVIENNRVVYNQLYIAAVSLGGILNFNVGGETLHKTDSDRGIKQSHIRNNTILHNSSYGLSCLNWRDGCTVVNNEVGWCNESRLYDCHATFFGGCFGMRIENNDIHDTFGYDNMGVAYGSAIGIDMSEVVDTACLGTGNILRGNRIYNCWTGPTNVGVCASAAIMLQNQNACIVEDNDIYNCRNGIAAYNVSTAVGAVGGHVIRNNTIRDIPYTTNQTLPYYSGAGVYLQDGNNIVVENNVMLNCGRFGLYVYNGLTGTVERNNGIYNCLYPYNFGPKPPTDANLTPGTLDATDITADPLLDAAGFMTSASPLRGSGRFNGYRADASGVQHSNPPSIGAREWQLKRVSIV